MKSFRRSGRSPGKVWIVCHIRNPKGAEAEPDPARQPQATSERAFSGQTFEAPSDGAVRRPNFEATQNIRLVIESPHCAYFPFERVTDSLDDSWYRIIKGRRLCQNARYRKRTRKMSTGDLAFSNDRCERQ